MLYVYGFAREAEVPPDLGSGVETGAVEAVTVAGLAALVTDVGPDGVRPRRANLLAHADVLQRAAQGATVLPLRFGTLLDDREAVQAHMAERAEDLRRRLSALECRIQMTVSAQYREAVVLREVMEEHPEVGRATRAIKGRPPAATHFDRLRLGEIVARAIDAKREEDSAAILGELRPHAVAVATDDPIHERMILNAAFLVDRERVAEFDAAVEVTSRRRATRMQFKLLGPLPPHAFVAEV